MNRQRVGEEAIIIDHLDEVGEVGRVMEHHGEVEDAISGPRKEAVSTNV